MIKRLMDELAELGKKDTDEFWEHLGHLHNAGLISLSEKHYMMGKACGYKECCIKNFINMQILGIPAAGFMSFVLGHKHVPGAEHVLCPLCYEEALTRISEDALVKVSYPKLGTKVSENQMWSKEEWVRTFIAA